MRTETFRVTTPKVRRRIRDVAIPPHLLPAIEHHLRKHVGPTVTRCCSRRRTAGTLQPSTLYRRCYTARDAARRDDLRWHDLRHTGAVLAAATGATLAELMARLGHSTPAAAMRYQHAAHGRDREIAALLSKLAERVRCPTRKTRQSGELRRIAESSCNYQCASWSTSRAGTRPKRRTAQSGTGGRHLPGGERPSKQIA